MAINQQKENNLHRLFENFTIIKTNTDTEIHLFFLHAEQHIAGSEKDAKPKSK